MQNKCENGNHTIGFSGSGKVTLDDYIVSGRVHPGEFYRHCPDCGVRIGFLDDLADQYESSICGHNAVLSGKPPRTEL